jgi:hypothetical protein
MTTSSLSKHRVEIKEPIRAAEIEDLVIQPALQTVQASTPLADATWEQLNTRLFARRADVELRVYGFYSAECDLSFLERMSNVRRFSADGLRQARGIDHLRALDRLEQLFLGIWALESWDCLRLIPPQLTSLSLGATKSRKPKLGILARFPLLRTLYLDGQQQEIEVIAELSKLQDLTLRSISTEGLRFLSKLQELWSLDIKLGGINDLSALEGMKSIKYLELWQVKGLRDVSVVSTLRGLQFLFLQSLPHVHCLPDLSHLNRLRKVYLENMKGITDFTPLANAPVLEEFIHVDARGRVPSDYSELLKCPTLRKATVGFGSTRKNEQFREMASKAGVGEYTRTDFSFA